MRLLPDDFKKMKQVEYWEDPVVNQQSAPEEQAIQAASTIPQATPMTQNANSPIQYHGHPPQPPHIVGGPNIANLGVEQKLGPRLDPRQSRERLSDQDPRLGGQWQSTKSVQSPGPPEHRLGTSIEPQVGSSYHCNPMDPTPMATSYHPEHVRPNIPYQSEPTRVTIPYQSDPAKVSTPYQSEPTRIVALYPTTAGGFSPDQRHFPADKPPTMWGVSSCSPEQSHSPISSNLRPHHQAGGVTGGAVKREGEGRRVDPRTKYAHLKIKSKGSGKGGSSPCQASSSSILKKAQGEDTEGGHSTFEVPKLLQDPSALNKPIDPRDLFKNAGSSEVSYGGGGGGGGTGPFGLFKSNLFSSRTQSQDNSDDRKSRRQFGEITLDQTTSIPRDENSNSSEQGDGKESNTTETHSDSSKSNKNTESEDPSAPAKVQVPSYFANLDVGLGSDLKIDSALGALASKNVEEEENGRRKEEKEELQARKLPSMFGFGF